MKQILATVLVIAVSNTAFGATDDPIEKEQREAAEKEQREAAERALQRFHFHVGPPGATVAYSSPSNGMTLGLEFARTSVVAGERLRGTMIVSNGGSVLVSLMTTRRDGGMDSEIGLFAVTDESGNIMPRTVPRYYRSGAGLSSRFQFLNPGESAGFDGDVVWGYALTNPGIYLVKALARLPLTNISDRIVTFEAESPPVAITVLPRPDGRLPPGNIYTNGMSAEQLEIFLEKEAIQKAREEAKRNGAVPQIDAPPTPTPPRERTAAVALDTSPAPRADPPTPPPARNVLYALLVLLLVGGLGFFVWSRHRQSKNQTHQ